MLVPLLPNSILTFIYSNKKETSDFHGTVSFDPVKIMQQKKLKMLIKRPTHKNGNYFILSYYFEG